MTLAGKIPEVLTGSARCGERLWMSLRILRNLTAGPGTYEESWFQYLYFDRIHTGVLRFVTVKSAPGDIVDVGCGTGRLLRKIRERWPHARLIGIDPAEGMVQKARHLMPDAAFMVSPAESIPLPDASADLVFSTDFFSSLVRPGTGYPRDTACLTSRGSVLSL